MTDRYLFTIPWPPSVNSYWVHRRRGNRIMAFLSPKAEQFRVACSIACHQQGIKNLNLQGPLAVSLSLYPPTKRRCDVDNFCKGTLDALTHAGVWGDDDQIQELRIRKCFSEGKPGRIDVVVWYEGRRQAA